YYGEERIAWAISFLLLLSHPGFSKPEQASEFKEQLVTYVRGLAAVLPSILEERSQESEEAADKAKLRELRVKSNLDMLLTEFGAHEAREPVQVIRYLHSQLLKAKQRHSPIDTNIHQAIEGLDRVLKRSASRQPQQRTPFPVELLHGVIARLDDGIYVAGQLQ